MMWASYVKYKTCREAGHIWMPDEDMGGLMCRRCGQRVTQRVADDYELKVKEVPDGY